VLHPRSIAEQREAQGKLEEHRHSQLECLELEGLGRWVGQREMLPGVDRVDRPSMGSFRKRETY